MTARAAVVTAKGARHLRRHSPWCYRTELVEAPDVSPGSVVGVVDPQGNWIGQAFLADRSPIALRLLTRRTFAEQAVDGSFFRERLASAIARRASLKSRDALRLVHAEADLLPGLCVDRYGQALVVQTLAQGADVRQELLVALLAELTGAPTIVLRNDGSGRDFEGLPREARLVRGDDPVVRFREGENVLSANLLEDFKTGSFLDQVDNHLRAGELGRGRALDLFTYHGGFALALSRTCERVLAVDQDPRAAAQAKANAEANGRGNVTVECANAFDLLKELDRGEQRFGTVVLDPPGFSKRREGLESALRAYHELNLRALRILEPDGLLVTCSCSGRVARDEFERMLLRAAADAKRPIQIVERRGAGIDHPVLPALPETDYLKAFFVRALPA